MSRARVLLRVTAAVLLALCPLRASAWTGPGELRSALAERPAETPKQTPATLAHHQHQHRHRGREPAGGGGGDGGDGGGDGEPCRACPGRGACVPRVQCPALARGDTRYTVCHLASGQLGVCCSTGQSHASESDRRQRSASALSADLLQSAHRASRQRVAEWSRREERIAGAGAGAGAGGGTRSTVVERGAPSFGHHMSTKGTDLVKSNELGRGALQNLFATQALRGRGAISDEQLRLGLADATDGPFCPRPATCSERPERHRRAAGACNNAAHPDWGAALTGYERVLPPDYEDGTWAPRASVRGGAPLTSARAASEALLPDVDNPSVLHNLMLTQFGQFLAHDLTAAVPLTLGNGSAISCCTPDGSGLLPPELLHFGCDAIAVDPTDPFYKQFGHTCMNFVRTQLAPSPDCSLGYARQMNGATHFADLSHLYGSSDDKVSELRDQETGRLRTFSDFGRELPPLTSNTDDCLTQHDGAACFASGDDHANQMISLVGLHTLWTREHNRLVEGLRLLNSSWTADTLFMEARRILIAEYQHIIYNEWLPLVIGAQAMDAFSLSPRPGAEHSSDYSPDINPSITSEFAAAAFRFGHSAIDTKLMIPARGKLYEEIAIPEVMFQPSRLRLTAFLDRMLTGLSWQPMQTVDPFVTEALTRYMFHGGHPFGLDLAAVNIQRGRDHGLRCYNDYRRLVGDKPPADFAQFSPKVAQRLSSVYASTEDVDLWVGGLLEHPLEGAAVGSTFSNILADQFSRLRRGDRYFYEHSPVVNPGAFTIDQLAEIKKATMSRLVCDNSDGVELVAHAPRAFLQPRVDGNAPVPCDSARLPRLDLTKFNEL